MLFNLTINENSKYKLTFDFIFTLVWARTEREEKLSFKVIWIIFSSIALFLV